MTKKSATHMVVFDRVFLRGQAYASHEKELHSEQVAVDSKHWYIGNGGNWRLKWKDLESLEIQNDSVLLLKFALHKRVVLEYHHSSRSSSNDPNASKDWNIFRSFVERKWNKQTDKPTKNEQEGARHPERRNVNSIATNRHSYGKSRLTPYKNKRPNRKLSRAEKLEKMLKEAEAQQWSDDEDRQKDNSEQKETESTIIIDEPQETEEDPIFVDTQQDQKNDIESSDDEEMFFESSESKQMQKDNVSTSEGETSLPKHKQKRVIDDDSDDDNNPGEERDADKDKDNQGSFLHLDALTTPAKHTQRLVSPKSSGGRTNLCAEMSLVKASAADEIETETPSSANGNSVVHTDMENVDMEIQDENHPKITGFFAARPAKEIKLKPIMKRTSPPPLFKSSSAMTSPKSPSSRRIPLTQDNAWLQQKSTPSANKHNAKHSSNTPVKRHTGWSSPIGVASPLAEQDLNHINIDTDMPSTPPRTTGPKMSRFFPSKLQKQSHPNPLSLDESKADEVEEEPPHTSTPNRAIKRRKFLSFTLRRNSEVTSKILPFDNNTNPHTDDTATTPNQCNNTAFADSALSMPHNPYLLSSQKRPKQYNLPQKFRGLRNLGNTCYLNASLQMLAPLFWRDAFQVALQPLSKQHNNSDDDNKENVVIIDRENESDTKEVSTSDNENQKDKPLSESIYQVCQELSLTNNQTEHTDNNETKDNVPSSPIAPAPTILRAVNPKPLKTVIDNMTSQFRGNEQRDAHEFVSDLVDRLHDEEVAAATISSTHAVDKGKEGKNDANKEERVSQQQQQEIKHMATSAFFRLDCKVSLRCEFCDYTRTKNEFYRHLSLEVEHTSNDNNPNANAPPPSTLQHGLSNFFQPERREIRCEKCEEGKEATQTLHISQESRPKALLLHLKRFVVAEQPKVAIQKKNSRMNSNNKPTTTDEMEDKENIPSYQNQIKDSLESPVEYEMVVSKNKAQVEIPQHLTLNAYYKNNENIDKKECEYELQSVVHHIGSTADSGHYTADSIRDGEWISFDDGISSPLKSTNTILHSEQKQRTAYMLLYTLKE